jgi:hypothetical protein
LVQWQRDLIFAAVFGVLVAPLLFWIGRGLLRGLCAATGITRWHERRSLRRQVEFLFSPEGQREIQHLAHKVVTEATEALEGVRPTPATPFQLRHPASLRSNETLETKGGANSGREENPRTRAD